MDDLEASCNDQENSLGVGWEEDAAQTLVELGDCPVDWLVTDHYSLDARWERRSGRLQRGSW
jgi:hypothetical protein